MIPDEAVEAARRAIEAAFPYDENNEYIVQLVLEAAAPHLMASAYEEGWLGARDFYVSANEPTGGLDANPYRRSGHE